MSGVFKEKYGPQALGVAVSTGNIELVKQLLSEPGVNPVVERGNPLWFAVNKGYVKIVKLLLNDPRVDPSIKGNYLIQSATFDGKTEIVKLLLSDPRVDPTTQSNYCIRWASAQGFTDIVKLLLRNYRVNPFVGDNFAVYWSNFHGYYEIVKMLIVRYFEIAILAISSMKWSSPNSCKGIKRLPDDIMYRICEIEFPYLQNINLKELYCLALKSIYKNTNEISEISTSRQ